MGSTPVTPDWGENPPPPHQPEEVSAEDLPAPLPAALWLCTGVKAKGMARKGEPHQLPLNSSPDQGTTDEEGRWMRGKCPDCGETTIWKGAAL